MPAIIRILTTAIIPAACFLLLSCQGSGTVTQVILRSAPATLSSKDVKTMIVEKGFYDIHKNAQGTGLVNAYEPMMNGAVIYDHASGLMWQQAGSRRYMRHHDAFDYIDRLNEQTFAGYDDWRLPTLEEALSLLESSKSEKGLFIDTLFAKRQVWIWTADTESPSIGWRTFFSDGYCGYYDASSTSYVRAVRAGAQL